jgi:sortase (surface protein transpeptidase)
VNWKAILAGGLSVSALAVIGIAVAGSPSTPTPAPAAVSATASASPIASVPASAPASVTTSAPMASVPVGAPADPMSTASIPAPTTPPVAQLAGQQVALPTSVSIPAIKAMSTLVPLGVNPDLTVQVPDLKTPGQAGWFDLGVRPGEIGSAVLLGHVDGGGTTGIFAQIGKLSLGDVISVGRADGSTVNFAVYKVTTVPKTDFPSQVFYGPTPGPELHLATCGGVLDRVHHNYLSSVLVYAKLVS